MTTSANEHTHGQGDAVAGARRPDDEPPGNGPPDRSQRALAAPSFSDGSGGGIDPSRLEGGCYLLKEKKPDVSYRVFEAIFERKLPGLIVTRQYPEHVRRERNLGAARIIWLSHTPGEDFQNPSAIGELAETLQKFIEDNNGEGVILLDGLEFLVINNGFLRTLRFVGHVNDFIRKQHGIVLLLVDPEILEEQEVALLEQVTKVLNPLVAQGAHAGVMLVPLDPAMLPACERLQRGLEPLLAVIDRTRDDPAKKVGRAFRDGIPLVVLVEGWVGEDGTYRVIQPGRPTVRMTLAELRHASRSKAVTPEEELGKTGTPEVGNLMERARATIASVAMEHRAAADPVVRDRQEQVLWEFATNPIFDAEVHDLAFAALRKVIAERPRAREAGKATPRTRRGGERGTAAELGVERTKPPMPSESATSGEEVASYPDTNRLGNVIAGWERSDTNPDLWHKTLPNGDWVSIESVAPNEYRWRLQTRDGKEMRGGGRGNLADAAREADEAHESESG